MLYCWYYIDTGYSTYMHNVTKMWMDRMMLKKYNDLKREISSLSLYFLIFQEFNFIDRITLMQNNSQGVLCN